MPTAILARRQPGLTFVAVAVPATNRSATARAEKSVSLMKKTDGGNDRRKNYVRRQITIHDNRGICSHAGYCTDNLKAVLQRGKEPWIDPDGATTQEIIDTIKLCPSGALSYLVEHTEFRD